MVSKERFTDIDLKFLPNPFNKKVKNLDEGVAILRSLTHILFISSGEKLYENQFGVGIERELFEINDFIALDVLKGRIRQQINNYEPRVVLDDVQLVESGLYMEITITVRYKSNPTQILTLQKTIKRIR